MVISESAFLSFFLVKSSYSRYYRKFLLNSTFNSIALCMFETSTKSGYITFEYWNHVNFVFEFNLKFSIWIFCWKYFYGNWIIKSEWIEFWLAELKISQKFSNKNNSDYPIFMNIFEIFEITFLSNLSYRNLMITFMDNLEFRPNVHREDATRFPQIFFLKIKKTVK